MDLSIRQEKALERLAGMPVPPAPPIPKAALIRIPRWYRWAPVGGLAVLAVLLVSLPLVSLPVALSDSHLTISVQSPADLRIEKMRRRLLSGRLEAELHLGKGELFLEADPNTPKQILIQTPFLQARITGTQLLIGHQPESGSRLVVFRGKVEVKAPTGGWELVPAGEELTVQPDQTVIRRLIQPEFDPAHIPTAPPETAGEMSESRPTGTKAGESLPGLIWHEQE